MIAAVTCTEVVSSRANLTARSLLASSYPTRRVEVCSHFSVLSFPV
jgi:hypothetical protein